MTSNIKTALLLAAMTGLILVMGQALGGKAGLMIAFVMALVMNVGSYWFSSSIVLAMYRAKELSPTDAPHLHRIVEELARKAEIPKPKICIIPDDAPNAFATGRNPEHGVVAVTEGIMRLLSPEELTGVLAHEIGHIKNRDILIQTIAGVMGSMITSIAQFALFFGGGRHDDEESGVHPIVGVLMALLAPVAAMLIQMAVSRSREYLADETGARLSHPLALAGALHKLAHGAEEAPMHLGSEATAHLFIVNPFTASKLASLFSTHPPMEERIARLQAMTRV